jgi:predicted DNA-binding antitoxin AbrB/MazE fold protein
METVNAIYKDGVLVLLEKIKPEELKRKRIRIKIIDEVQHRNEKSIKLKSIYKYLHKSNPFSGIKDVVKWQRQTRTDREILN